MSRALRAFPVVCALLMATARGRPAKSKLPAGGSETFINPDAAMGRTFHVNAKQIDGVQRCYFIVVGKRVEQGPIHLRNNQECAARYERKIKLGGYTRTTGGPTPRQEYAQGDSHQCGRGVKRSTTLTMALRQQDEITAHVHEPRRCVYEVTLYGSVFQLAGGEGDPLLTGGGGNARLAGGSGQAAAKRSAGSGAESERRRQPKRMPESHWERIKREAAEVVRSTSRAELMSKPAKALQQLLRDLGASCRSCAEKAHLVDRLRDAVEVRSDL